MIFVALLILISVLFPTLILAQDSNEIPFDKLKTPTELQDIIDNFDRLKYNFKAFKDGEREVDIIEIKGNNLAKHGLKSGTLKLAEFRDQYKEFTEKGLKVEGKGKAAIYGINFDVDSAKIKEESKSAIEKRAKNRRVELVKK